MAHVLKQYVIHKRFFIDLMESSQSPITWGKQEAEKAVYKFACRLAGEAQVACDSIRDSDKSWILHVSIRDKVFF